MQTPPPPDATRFNHDHAVHFYADPAVMEGHVASFIRAGIQAGESVITIATKDRREGFARHLRLAFPEFEGRIEALPHYCELDADEVLSTFLVRAWPERDEFFHTMDRVFMKPAREGRPLRVYGEMVVRLWQAGNAEGAYHLEEFWNLLAHRYSFNLLCAYPLYLFRDQEHQRFLDTCAVHNRISFAPGSQPGLCLV